MSSTYLMVDAKIVPGVYMKVIEAKQKISSGKFKSTNEAIRDVGISRSTFYKYKDYVFACSDLLKDKLVSLEFTLDDIPGVLSKILNILAANSASVLTINQNIPINDIANVTITFKLDNVLGDLEGILDVLKKVEGVNKIRIIAMN